MQYEPTLRLQRWAQNVARTIDIGVVHNVFESVAIKNKTEKETDFFLQLTSEIKIKIHFLPWRYN